MFKYLAVASALLIATPAFAAVGAPEVGMMKGHSVLLTSYNGSQKEFNAAVNASKKFAAKMSGADGKPPQITECQDVRKKYVLCKLTPLSYEGDLAEGKTVEYVVETTVSAAEARMQTEFKDVASPIPGPCTQSKSSLKCDLIYLELGE